MKYLILVTLLLTSFSTIARTPSAQCLKADVEDSKLSFVMNILERNYMTYKIYREDGALKAMVTDINYDQGPLATKLYHLKNMPLLKDFGIEFVETTFSECYDFPRLRDITSFVRFR